MTCLNFSVRPNILKFCSAKMKSLISFFSCLNCTAIRLLIPDAQEVGAYKQPRAAYTHRKSEVMKKRRRESEFHIIPYLFSCIFILLSRESDQSAVRADLGVASHLSTTPRWGNPPKCPSRRHNKQTCRLVLHTVPLMLSVKQGSCEYQFYSHWFDPTRNDTRVYSSRDRRSIPLGRLSCYLIGHLFCTTRPYYVNALSEKEHDSFTGKRFCNNTIRKDSFATV